MKGYTEAELQQAIEDVKNGAGIREASIKWSIPRSTLQGRLKGQITQSEAQIDYQRLSPAQEERLTAWIIAQEAIGLGLTHSQIRSFANRILKLQGILQPIGQKWVTGFFRRNPSIKTKRARKVDSLRVTAATTQVLKDWFPLFNLPAVRAVKLANRWNVDEAGIAEGAGTNGLIVGSRFTNAIAQKKPGSRTWISFIECISAEGQALDPLVIYKGVNVQQQWFPTVISDLEQYRTWSFTSTPKGWTTNATGLEWLLKIFIPRSQPDNPQEPRLLILDGHGSHSTTDFIWNCYINNIFLLFLLPHSSHLLQPLDLSIFSSMKTAYQKELGKLTGILTSTTVGKRLFLHCYNTARIASLTNQNIKSS